MVYFFRNSAATIPKTWSLNHSLKRHESTNSNKIRKNDTFLFKKKYDDFFILNEVFYEKMVDCFILNIPSWALC